MFCFSRFSFPRTPFRVSFGLNSKVLRRGSPQCHLSELRKSQFSTVRTLHNRWSLRAITKSQVFLSSISGIWYNVLPNPCYSVRIVHPQPSFEVLEVQRYTVGYRLECSPGKVLIVRVRTTQLKKRSVNVCDVVQSQRIQRKLDTLRRGNEKRRIINKQRVSDLKQMRKNMSANFIRRQEIERVLDHQHRCLHQVAPKRQKGKTPHHSTEVFTTTHEVLQITQYDGETTLR